MPVVNSTDVSATSSVPSLQSIVTSVWEQNVCKAKEVETQSRYSQTERSALVTDRVAAALSGFIMPPYQYNHQNDRL